MRAAGVGDRPGGERPAWYAAHRDPVAWHALRLLHAEPAAPWTDAEPAGRARVSRATLGKRFADLVGKPPLTYLPALAADAGRRPSASARRSRGPAA